jgi:plastocyanin
MLALLEPKAGAVQELRDKGCVVEFYCGLFIGRWNEGTMIAANTLGRIAALGANLALDVYWTPERDEDDRTIIPEDEATHTVNLTVTDDGTESGTRFDPPTLTVIAGETVRVAIKNTGQDTHGVRFAGPDGQYVTPDDFVSNPEILKPGEEGFVVIRFETPGTYEFRDTTVPHVTGQLVVNSS